MRSLSAVFGALAATSALAECMSDAMLVTPEAGSRHLGDTVAGLYELNVKWQCSDTAVYMRQASVSYDVLGNRRDRPRLYLYWNDADNEAGMQARWQFGVRACSPMAVLTIPSEENVMPYKLLNDVWTNPALTNEARTTPTRDDLVNVGLDTRLAAHPHLNQLTMDQAKLDPKIKAQLVIECATAKQVSEAAAASESGDAHSHVLGHPKAWRGLAKPAAGAAAEDEDALTSWMDTDKHPLVIPMLASASLLVGACIMQIHSTRSQSRQLGRRKKYRSTATVPSAGTKETDGLFAGGGAKRSKRRVNALY